MRTWHLADLFTEPPAGHMSLQKFWGNVGGATLSTAFLRLAWTRDLTYDVFVGYAFALAVVVSPALAAKLMGLRYGQASSTQTTTQTSTTTNVAAPKEDK